nr:glycoside hydrolase family 3 C-terminal domain-containing protein [Lachnospiraceae bacterium]
MRRNYQWRKSIAGLMASAMVATTVVGGAIPVYAQDAFKRNSSTEVTDLEKANYEVAQKAAEEGMVLLKNENNTLPIAKSSKVALFGAGAYYSVTGGTGSGDVNQRDDETISVYDGLSDVYTITSKDWVEHYGELFEASKESGDGKVCTTSGSVGLYSYFPNEIAIDDEYITSAKADTDTAIFVVTRNSGEGADRTTSAGDYYLSALEKENLEKVTAAFDHVVVVLNVGGVMDMEYLESAENVDSIFLMSQAGMRQGKALADIFDGAVSPSGKLT